MTRNVWLLLGILALLTIITVVVMQRPGETSVTDADANVLFSYDSSAIDRIEVVSNVGNVTLEKEAGKWMLTTPFRYGADLNAVTSAISKGRQLSPVTGAVSTNPEKQHIFQVDSAGTLVRMFAKGQQVASFRVGKPSSSYTETYVRREGSNEVFLVDGIISSTFARPTDDWRDKTIFSIDKDKISSVRFQYGDTTFTLAFEDSTWRIGRDSTKDYVVQGFLNAIANFQANEIIDSVISPLPRIVAAIELEGTQIRFHQEKDASKYYVQSSRSPQWYEVQNWRASQVLKRRHEFLAIASG